MVYLKIAAEALAHVGMCIQPVWSLDPDSPVPLTVRVTVGHRARAGPVKPCPAFTLSYGPWRVKEASGP